MTEPLTSWSYSRWDEHHTCPLKFKLHVLDGGKMPASPQMERGNQMHKSIAAYLQNPAGLAPPKAAGQQEALVRQLTEFDNKLVEQQWGFTRQWKPTGWFGNATWLRSVLDVAVLYDDMSAEVIDWKSGKPRGTHEDQMELFAVSAFCHTPAITHITTRLAYLDFEHAEFAEFKAADKDKLVAKWEKKVAPMFEDTTYLPRPGDACRFCPFSKSAGGECRYG